MYMYMYGRYAMYSHTQLQYNYPGQKRNLDFGLVLRVGPPLHSTPPRPRLAYTRKYQNLNHTASGSTTAVTRIRNALAAHYI